MATGFSSKAVSQQKDQDHKQRVHQDWTSLTEDIKIINNTSEEHGVSIEGRRDVSKGTTPLVLEQERKIPTEKEKKPTYCEPIQSKIWGPGKFYISVSVDGKRSKKIPWFIPKHAIGGKSGEIPPTRQLVIHLKEGLELTINKVKI